MDHLSHTIASELIHQFTDFNRRVRTLAQELNEEQFWIKPYPYGNSFGNLVLHVTGNLNYYIGAQIAETGYIRKRELEFTETHVGKKEESLSALDAAIDTVIATLETQTDSDWEHSYSAVGVDDVSSRFGIYLRCAVHFHHHIGQMIYLVKEITRAS